MKFLNYYKKYKKYKFPAVLNPPKHCTKTMYNHTYYTQSHKSHVIPSLLHRSAPFYSLIFSGNDHVVS